MIFLTSLYNVFLLAQNSIEKRITILSLTLFASFMLYLALDSTIKGRLVPKNKSIRKFVIFVALLTIVALFFLMKFVY